MNVADRLVVPPEYDWQVWRIISAERMQVSLIELERDWTLNDVEQAHLTLDILEDSQILSRPKA